MGEGWCGGGGGGGADWGGGRLLDILGLDLLNAFEQKSGGSII